MEDMDMFLPFPYSKHQSHGRRDDARIHGISSGGIIVMRF